MYNNNKRLLLAILSLLLLIGCAPRRAQAQFLGYTSPQTIQSQLANSVACTGGAQNFITGVTAGFSNLGQTQHYITIVPSASVISIRAEIDGIDKSGAVFRISDVLTGAAAGTLPLSVSASGYYPQIQIAVTCGTATGTFSLSYSGASSTFNSTTGSYLLGQIDKTIFAGAAANTNSPIITIQTPFGDSEGTLVFFYNVAGPGGSTLQVSCSGNTVGLASQIFTLATAGSVQSLPVARGTCPSIQVNYVSGGASAALYSVEYIFTVPGKQVPATAQPTAQSNTEQTSAANSAVSKTITGTTNTRAHLFSVSARCSAGTAQLTVTDGGTQIWSSGATEVSTTTFRFQWNPGLAASFFSTMTITLGTCGAANTGTLDVQSSQF